MDEIVFRSKTIKSVSSSEINQIAREILESQYTTANMVISRNDLANTTLMNVNCAFLAYELIESIIEKKGSSSSLLKVKKRKIKEFYAAFSDYLDATPKEKILDRLFRYLIGGSLQKFLKQYPYLCTQSELNTLIDELNEKVPDTVVKTKSTIALVAFLCAISKIQESDFKMAMMCLHYMSKKFTFSSDAVEFAREFLCSNFSSFLMRWGGGIANYRTISSVIRLIDDPTCAYQLLKKLFNSVILREPNLSLLGTVEYLIEVCLPLKEEKIWELLEIDPELTIHYLDKLGGNSGYIQLEIFNKVLEKCTLHDELEHGMSTLMSHLKLEKEEDRYKCAMAFLNDRKQTHYNTNLSCFQISNQELKYRLGMEMVQKCSSIFINNFDLFVNLEIEQFLDIVKKGCEANPEYFLMIMLMKFDRFKEKPPQFQSALLTYLMNFGMKEYPCRILNYIDKLPLSLFSEDHGEWIINMLNLQKEDKLHKVIYELLPILDAFSIKEESGKLQIFNKIMALSFKSDVQYGIITTLAKHFSRLKIQCPSTRWNIFQKLYSYFIKFARDNNAVFHIAQFRLTYDERLFVAKNFAKQSEIQLASYLDGFHLKPEDLEPFIKEFMYSKNLRFRAVEIIEKTDFSKDKLYELFMQLSHQLEGYQLRFAINSPKFWIFEEAKQILLLNEYMKQIDSIKEKTSLEELYLAIAYNYDKTSFLNKEHRLYLFEKILENIGFSILATNLNTFPLEESKGWKKYVETVLEGHCKLYTAPHKVLDSIIKVNRPRNAPKHVGAMLRQFGTKLSEEQQLIFARNLPSSERKAISQAAHPSVRQTLLFENLINVHSSKKALKLIKEFDGNFLELRPNFPKIEHIKLHVIIREQLQSLWAKGNVQKAPPSIRKMLQYAETHWKDEPVYKTRFMQLILLISLESRQNELLRTSLTENENFGDFVCSLCEARGDISQQLLNCLIQCIDAPDHLKRVIHTLPQCAKGSRKTRYLNHMSLLLSTKWGEGYFPANALSNKEKKYWSDNLKILPIFKVLQSLNEPKELKQVRNDINYLISRKFTKSRIDFHKELVKKIEANREKILVLIDSSLKKMSVEDLREIEFLMTALGISHFCKHIGKFEKDSLQQVKESLLVELLGAHPEPDLYSKYITQFEKLEKRRKNALFEYISSFENSVQKSNVRTNLSLFVNSILQGGQEAFQQVRYDVTQSEHLKVIYENYPSVFKRWIEGDEFTVDHINEDEECFNFQKYFNERIFQWEHLGEGWRDKYNYLANMNSNDLDTILDQIQHDKRQVEKEKDLYVNLRVQELIIEGYIASDNNPSKLQEILKLLYNKLPETNVLKEDIEDAMKMVKKLPATSSNGPYHVLDTDDYAHLFLSGTEILGSCQRISNTHDYNCALMGICLRGAIRLVAVTNQNGHLIGRCLLRLLWDEKKNIPVLFADHLYINNYKSGVSKLIHEMCQRTSKRLGIPLVSMRFLVDSESHNHYQLVSLGKRQRLPEYVDAGGLKIQWGSYRLPEGIGHSE